MTLLIYDKCQNKIELVCFCIIIILFDFRMSIFIKEHPLQTCSAWFAMNDRKV